jgi:hypothetical protein
VLSDGLRAGSTPLRGGADFEAEPEAELGASGRIG